MEGDIQDILLRIEPEPCSSPTGRTGNVSFKPYDDIRLNPRKKFKYPGSDEEQEQGSAPDTRTVEDLYPELLCLIFSNLDVQSKGRAAQVLLE